MTLQGQVYQISAFTAFYLMVGASQAIASPCSTSESHYAIQSAKTERDYILANFKENDVSSAVDRFQNALNKCDIPLSSFGLGNGALDYWKKTGYEAAYSRAKARLEYTSQFRADPQDAAEVKKYATRLELDAQKTQRYIDDSLVRGAKSMSSEKSQCQPTVDLRSDSLGQVRDQDSVGWCYAFVAADLLSYKLGKKISAADIAIANNDSWINGIFKRFGSSETDFEGGLAADVIMDTKSKGWCLEAKLSSEDNSNWNLRSMLKEVEQLKKQYSGDAASNPANCANARRLFQGLDTAAVIDIINKTSKAAFVPALADKSCQPRIKDQSIKTQMKSINFSSDTSPLFKAIDEQLNKKNVAAISYDAAALYNRDYKEPLESHSSVIVGRRFNAKTNECDYLIRNSWGRSCSSYDGSYDCQEGNVWVPKAALYRGIRRVHYIE